MKTHKIVQRRKNCIGCNSCVLIAPNNWKMNAKDGKVDLIGGIKKGDQLFVAEIFDDELQANKMAAKACPMQIIAIEGTSK
jgi:ferredoxin